MTGLAGRERTPTRKLSRCSNQLHLVYAFLDAHDGEINHRRNENESSIIPSAHSKTHRYPRLEARDLGIICDGLMSTVYRS
jgi:hypothetical protein